MYQVKFYKGDYYARQKKANQDGCIAYVEHHFNSAGSPYAQYTCVIVGSNASQTSKNWGRWYAKAVATEFDIPLGGDKGIVVGGFNGRGDGNVKYTSMPAVLLEPLFVSNPQQAEWVRSEFGQTKLARILQESILRFFPKGGLIGFSVGHKYKDSRPDDRGAMVYGGGTEAEYAEKILVQAKNLLEKIDEPIHEYDVRVIKNNRLVWKQEIDEDANITWDPVRRVLTIDE